MKIRQADSEKPFDEFVVGRRINGAWVQEPD